MNLNVPVWDSDALAPVYAAGDGVVIFAGVLPSTWGNVVIIKHSTEPIIYSRSAHLDSFIVQKGQQVSKNQKIGNVGNAFGSLPYHLHYDLSLTNILESIPGHWPGGNIDLVRQHYVEPRALTLISQSGFTNKQMVVKSAANFRAGPKTSFRVYETLLTGTKVTVLGLVNEFNLVKVGIYYGFIHSSLLQESSTGVEMSPYFLPSAGNFGDVCILKNNWSGGDERQQLQKDGAYSYVTKNQQWERRKIATTGIFLELDTSPGNNEYYTVEGTSWLPVRWNVGDEHTRTETVSFFSKGDCQPLSLPYTVTNKIRFNKLYPSWTSQGGIILNNVVELQWLIAGQVEETYWFAPGKGLVGWSNRSGKKSWITEVIPVGQQENNTRESGCFS